MALVRQLKTAVFSAEIKVRVYRRLVLKVLINKKSNICIGIKNSIIYLKSYFIFQVLY